MRRAAADRAEETEPGNRGPPATAIVFDDSQIGFDRFRDGAFPISQPLWDKP